MIEYVGTAEKASGTEWFPKRRLCVQVAFVGGLQHGEQSGWACPVVVMYDPLHSLCSVYILPAKDCPAPQCF